MLLYQRFIPGLTINSYIVGDKNSGIPSAINPTRDVENYIQYVNDNDLKLKYILETHAHADYARGSRELKGRLKGGPTIICSHYDGKQWTQSHVDQLLNQTQVVSSKT